MIKEAIDNGLLMENGEKRSQKRSDLTISEDKNGQKQPNLAENDEGKSQKPSNLTEKDSEKKNKPTISDFPSILVWNVYESIRQNRKAKYSWLQDNLGVSEATIKRAISDLKKMGYISKEHSKIKGEWQLQK